MGRVGRISGSGFSSCRKADKPGDGDRYIGTRGLRDWKVLGASHRLDKGEIRLILSNETAWRAELEGVLPFPEGSIIAKLAYKAQNSKEWKDGVIPGPCRGWSSW